VRPNSGQVEWAAKYFRDNLLRIKADGSRDEAFNAATQAPPQEAICIHVRHGDKGIEMTYVRPLLKRESTERGLNDPRRDTCDLLV
jgi:hypothetical protein